MNALQFFCRLFGYDYQTLLQFPQASRQKVLTLGTLMLIPIGIYSFIGFYFSYVMAGLPLPTAIMVSLVLGSGIFLIDRSFISGPSNVHRGVAWTRIGIAGLMTLVGALVLDLIIFSGDLKEYSTAQHKQLIEQAKEEYENLHSETLGRIEAHMVDERINYAKLESEFLHEISGTGGSGRPNVGPIAKAKEKLMLYAAAKIAKLEADYALERGNLEANAEKFAADKHPYSEAALLSRLKELKDFMLKDWMSFGFWLIILVLLFLVETLFLWYKLGSDESAYELYIRGQEEHRKSKINALLRRQNGLISKEIEFRDSMMIGNQSGMRRLA